VRRNPFLYGNPIDDKTPENFVDREEHLDTVVRSMLAGRSVILMAPRRYGKTSLLYQALAEVRARGGRTGRVSVGDAASPRDAAQLLLGAVLTGPAGWLERQEEAVRSRLARMRPGVELTPEGHVRFAVSVGDDHRTWRSLVQEILRVLGDVASDEAPVSMVVDEFQRLHELDAALPAVFKAISDELTTVSLVLSGSRRHLMDQLSRGAAPLARVGTKLTLPRIPEAPMVDFLQRRSSEGGKMMAAGVAEQIYGAADGIPNEVQQLAHWAFEEATRRVTETDVDAAIHRVVGQNRFEFIVIFRSVSPAQQRLLRLLAHGPVRSLQTRAVVAELGVANGSAVRWAARRLEEEDIIEQAPEGWRISSPFFLLWLRDSARYE
jgi:hypothetical protein